MAWNTMIVAYSMHGCGEESLSVFNHTINIRPDSATFSGLLSACNHSLLASPACWVSSAMKRDYGEEPIADHYACMADVLSRAGKPNKACEFIKNMPMKPTPSARGTLLSGCKVYKNVKLVKIAVGVLFVWFISNCRTLRTTCRL